MKERLAKLLAVKSIVTIILTVVFAVLALTNRLTAQDVMTIFTVIVSFYFGTQHEKKNGGDNPSATVGGISPYTGETLVVTENTDPEEKALRRIGFESAEDGEEEGTEDA